MNNGPLERQYGRYRITFRKDDHVCGRTPSPHVEIWKGSKKLGNFDMASGKAEYKRQPLPPKEIRQAIAKYLGDPQVVRKVTEMIKGSYFDLAKPAGEYGGIPKGFKVTISVAYSYKSLEGLNENGSDRKMG
ncbi:MAG: hypothetical protein PHH49_04930 [Candidatus Omnitrophica bacterium]|nr:hypothetical protein [Candidatus Omnitrophota bacterium]MDD5488289.1 hypothetical protein [Candidatus Omnitrophota bacterium]